MSNIKSFNELGEGAHSDEQDSDDGGGFNDYYAGGEKSGQLIRGAPKKDKDDKDKDSVQALFDKAKRSGAVQGTSDDLQQPSAAFAGSGRTIAGSSAQASRPQAAGPVTYVITFYRNNVFTVNDGPARRVDDPANMAFISSISKGECPEELEPPVRGTPITVNLVRSEQEYKEPEKPKYTAFVGSGRTLGTSGPGASSEAGPSSSAAASAAEGEWEGVNEAQPTTSLQLRLADGARLVARFNHSHRVSDIRRFIRASRPDMTFSYTLATGVPPKPVGDEAQTLTEAGLLNAVIIQRK
ncbi:ubiquitin-related domain-containing protein [Haematococcus lacustris]